MFRYIVATGSVGVKMVSIDVIDESAIDQYAVAAISQMSLYFLYWYLSVNVFPSRQ